MTNPTTPPTLKDDVEYTKGRAYKTGYDDGFIFGQQSADDKWLKLIDDLNNRFLLRSWTPEQLLSIQHFIEELKSLSQNSPRSKPENMSRTGEQATRDTDKTADRMPDGVNVTTVRNSSNSTSGSPTLCPNCFYPVFGLSQHLDDEGDYLCKSFTPQPEKPEKERRGE